MKLAVGLVVSMFVLGSVSLLYTAYKDNKNLDKSLVVNRRRADSLFTVNDSNLQRLQLLKTKMDSAAAKGNELIKSATQANARLGTMNREIERSQQAKDSANKKIEQLLASQSADGNHWKELKAKNDKLEKEKKDLDSRIMVLSTSNEQLNEALRIVKDNILIETFSQNGKLNVKGKRVKKIAATLSVPFELKKPNFKFFDSTGKLLTAEHCSFDFHSLYDASSTFAGGSKPAKVELSYSPLKKMSSGIYKIEMLDGNRHIGNLMVSLR